MKTPRTKAARKPAPAKPRTAPADAAAKSRKLVLKKPTSGSVQFKSTRGRAKSAASNVDSGLVPTTSRRVPDAAAPGADYIEPMKALGVGQPPSGDWHFEIKFDGYRALGLIRKGRAELWSRNRKSLSADYPEVWTALAQLRCRDAVVDGEIVALDADGRPTFQLLQGLQMNAERPPIYFYVFDLLKLDGRSFLDEPIEVRLAALGELLKDAPSVLRASPVFSGSAETLLKEVKRRGLEGIVAKRHHSLYEPGRRSGAWSKYRLVTEQELVIAGYTPPKGGRTHFGALLVGYYNHEGQLLYAGKVGTGFNATRLAELHALFAKQRVAECPFSNLPMDRRSRFGTGMTAREMREVTWLKPHFVGQFKFSEWTREGLLRQPVFLGLRKDKRAREVVREVVSTSGTTRTA